MPGPNKTGLASTNGITSLLGIAGKTISSIDVFKAGTVEVVDILCTDAVHYYIKISQGRVDVGGTTDLGSGTFIGGR